MADSMGQSFENDPGTLILKTEVLVLRSLVTSMALGLPREALPPAERDVLDEILDNTPGEG
jgi:hypothetical protein